MKWYTVEMNVALPEGKSAHEIDMMLYKILRHSDLHYAVERIIAIEDYDVEE